jgi:hypothetical protein
MANRDAKKKETKGKKAQKTLKEKRDAKRAKKK